MNIAIQTEIFPALPSIQLNSGPYIDDIDDGIIAKAFEITGMSNSKFKERNKIVKNKIENKLIMKKSSTDLLKNVSMDRELKITKSMI